MLVLKKLFKPSGQKFYRLFDAAGNNLVEMSRLLVQVVHEKNISVRNSSVDEIRKLEESNDAITHQLFTELSRNFITPFDREDIHDLASALDEIGDYILNMAVLLRNYDLNESGNATQKVASEIHQTIKLLVALLAELSDKSGLNSLYERCIEIYKSTQSSDHTIDMAIAGLLHKDADAVLVVKMMDHYESAQTLVGKCNDLVTVIESVIVKYG